MTDAMQSNRNGFAAKEVPLSTDKSCKSASKQTLSKCEDSPKKLFPFALDTAPYSQKPSYFH
jgi:hypothetical protein